MKNGFFSFLIFIMICTSKPTHSMSTADLNASIHERKAHIKEMKLNIARLKKSIEARKKRLQVSYPCTQPKLFYKKKYEDDSWHEWKEEPLTKDIEREFALRKYQEHQELLMAYLLSTKEQREEDFFLKSYIESSFPAPPSYLSDSSGSEVEDDYYEQAIRDAI